MTEIAPPNHVTKPRHKSHVMLAGDGPESRASVFQIVIENGPDRI